MPSFQAYAYEGLAPEQQANLMTADRYEFHDLVFYREEPENFQMDYQSIAQNGGWYRAQAPWKQVLCSNQLNYGTIKRQMDSNHRPQYPDACINPIAPNGIPCPKQAGTRALYRNAATVRIQ
jgi:hypothetical protein